MTSLEVVAGLLALLVLVKAIGLAVWRETLFKIRERMVRQSMPWGACLLILSFVFAWVVLRVMTLVEIFAAAAFISFFMSASLLLIAPESIRVSNEILRRRISGIAWLLTAAWVVLSLLVLLEIFVS